MAVEIWIAVISGLFSVIGVIVTSVCGNKSYNKKSKEQTDITLYRLDQLERKVELHNNAVERLFELERRLDVDEEKIKVANHRIDDLEEDYGKV